MQRLKTCNLRMDLMHGVSSSREIVAFTLGMISVASWGVAEVPQIITNHKDKSADGLSVTFLMTWIIGDVFNLAGCLLEPTTLPTQFYMALLYTATTIVLAAQAIYYGCLDERRRKASKINELEQEDALAKEKLVGMNSDERGSSPIKTLGNVSTSPILVTRSAGSNSSIGRDLYYKSARSLSSSPVPTAGSWLAHTRDSYRTPSNKTPSTLTEDQNFSREPLLGSLPSQHLTPSPGNKNMLCVVSSTVFFLGISGLQLLRNDAFGTKPQGMVFPIGRKLLQYYALESLPNEGGGSSEIGSLLGWAMAAIYMGGRLPQIWLNIRRGNVEGLSPFMFFFALLGNSTYVGSILANSLEWSTIRPNMPWLVDAAGCVVLDAFILIQFIYFNYRKSHDDQHLYDT